MATPHSGSPLRTAIDDPALREMYNSIYKYQDDLNIIIDAVQLRANNGFDSEEQLMESTLSCLQLPAAALGIVCALMMDLKRRCARDAQAGQYECDEALKERLEDISFLKKLFEVIHNRLVGGEGLNGV